MPPTNNEMYLNLHSIKIIPYNTLKHLRLSETNVILTIRTPISQKCYILILKDNQITLCF